MNVKINLIIFVLLYIGRVFSTLPVITRPDPAGSTTITIPENTNVGDTIYTVVASDPDGDTLFYSVFPDDKFSISNTSGHLQVSVSFDYEDVGDRTHAIIIQVSDGSDVVNVSTTISITDVNDNSPQFYPPTYAVSTDENTPAGTSLLELNCTDIDSGGNGDCSITIQSGDQNPPQFTITGSTLYTTKNLLDYETKPEVNLIVLGQDNPSSGSPNTATANISVTVNDVNEPPVFLDNPTIRISENSTTPLNIYRYIGRDQDTFVLYGISRYDIVSVTNNGMNIFGIFAFTGYIKLENPVDYETVNMYEIVVVATDYGNLKGTGTVTVSITDINDNEPVCSPGTYKTTISENVAKSTVVVSDLSCTDADSGMNSQLNYTLILNPNSKFSLKINKNIASIIVSSDLNYRTTPFYQLKVNVSDNGTPMLSTVITVNINVTAASEVVQWIETTEGIATITTCAVLGLVCIVMATALIRHYCFKKR